METKKTVAVDLDGVLAEHDEWVGVEFFGDPIEGAREFLQELKEMGCEILIHTTRCNKVLNSSELGLRERVLDGECLRESVSKWMEDHDMPFDRVHVGQGKPLAIAYVDDRGIRCRPQKGDGEYQKALDQVRENMGESESGVYKEPTADSYVFQENYQAVEEYLELHYPVGAYHWEANPCTGNPASLVIRVSRDDGKTITKEAAPFARDHGISTEVIDSMAVRMRGKVVQHVNIRTVDMLEDVNAALKE